MSENGTNGNGQHAPLTAAGDGRSARGRFTAGNRFGKGNPANRRAQMLRATYIKSVSRQDMAEIVAAIMKAAKAGDVSAAKELTDRLLGKAPSADLLERIERLEQLLTEKR